MGEDPILWHILQTYSTHGLNDFIICLGYKAEVIKEYFASYFLSAADVAYDFTHASGPKMTVHHSGAEPWRVTLVDTGLETGTGGRLAKVAKYVRDEEAFGVTYDDGVSDVDITATIAFHKSHGKALTLTAVRPIARFGALGLDDERVMQFREKPDEEGGWVNGGFLVLCPRAIEYVKSDEQMLEGEPIEELVNRDEVRAYFHHGFWQSMDTLKDKLTLQKLWDKGNAPWLKGGKAKMNGANGA